MFRRLALCLALLGPLAAVALVAPTSAAAQTAVQLTADERAGLEARVAEMTGYVDAGQFEAIMDFLPPRLLSTIAEHFGVDEAEARAATKASVREVMSSVTIVQYDIDVDGAQAFVTPDGSRRYVTFDLTMLMEVEDIQVRAITPNLAFMVDGVWYIMDPSSPDQAAMLRKAYPEFEGVRFDSGTMEVVEP